MIAHQARMVPATEVCALLPQILEGEDPDFVARIRKIADDENGCVGVSSTDVPA